MFLCSSFLGRGVFTNRDIEPSAFVVEYRGNIFPQNDTRPENRRGDSLNGFLYRFTWNGAQWWYVICLFFVLKRDFLATVSKLSFHMENCSYSTNSSCFLCSVDASKEDRSLGRLVNDDHISPNCEVRKIVFQGKPHLCLFAAERISQGDEITFNYGDFSYPWRSRVGL